jgi:hypothetical protein
MLIPVLYVVPILVILPLIFWIQFKIKNPFWSCQPVIHPHHLFQKWTTPHVIKDDFYIQKFMNPLNIETVQWNSLTEERKKEFTSFISQHFYNKSGFKYLPTEEKHITPYFSRDKNSYLSTYTTSGIPVGTITNRTLRIHFSETSFLVSYIDFLCVHQGHRKKQVAPELIQTHEYFQRTKSPHKSLVSLFKKEGKLHDFMPLVEYKTLVCDLKKQTKIPRGVIHSQYSVVPFSLSNQKEILNHLSEIKNQYSCFVIPTIESLNEIIERKSIQIYGLIDRKSQEIFASYWFRDTGFYCQNDKPNIECFASTFHHKKCAEQDFIHGFLEAVTSIAPDFNWLQLECLGDNGYFYNLSWICEYKTPCAYYIYNYHHKPLKPHQITLLI